MRRVRRHTGWYNLIDFIKLRGSEEIPLQFVSICEFARAPGNRTWLVHSPFPLPQNQLRSPLAALSAPGTHVLALGVLSPLAPGNFSVVSASI